MSLHDDIMNIKTHGHIETLPDPVRIAYKNGHKVARHDAAELSAKYESALNEACSALMTLYRYDDVAKRAMDKINNIILGE
jgi:hypothetical protein